MLRLARVQVLPPLARDGVLHEAELDEGREVEEDDEGAELEGRQEGLAARGGLPSASVLSVVAFLRHGGSFLRPGGRPSCA